MTNIQNVIQMTLVILAAGSVAEKQANAIIAKAVGNDVDEMFINAVVAGVKSGAVKPEAAAKQLADMAAAAEEANANTAAPVVTNTASDSGIIVSGINNVITFAAPGVVAGNGKKDKSSKAAKGESKDDKKAKMTAEESDKALESADHAVAVWYEKDTKSGTAIYKVDGNEKDSGNGYDGWCDCGSRRFINSGPSRRVQL